MFPGEVTVAGPLPLGAAEPAGEMITLVGASVQAKIAGDRLKAVLSTLDLVYLLGEQIFFDCLVHRVEVDVRLFDDVALPKEEVSLGGLGRFRGTKIGHRDLESAWPGREWSCVE